jgi:hypothetical protein
MPRGNDIHVRASRRIRNDHTDRAADEFDHQLLSDGVRERVLQDTQLAQLEDAIATTENARERRRAELDGQSQDHGAPVASAMDELQAVVRQRVMELCAEQATTALEDGDQWAEEADHISEEDVEAVQAEAATWLLDHPDVCQRVFDGVPDHAYHGNDEVTA